MPARIYTPFIPVWKEAPILRFLVPLIPGILFQWYAPLQGWQLPVLSVFLLLFFIGALVTKFKATKWFGVSMYAVVFVIGCWLVVIKDKRNWNDFIGKHYYENETVIAELAEPLVNKPKSYKAEASIRLLDSLGNIKKVAGRIIVYLQKDSSMPSLNYGSRIIFKKPLQRIKNAGNPGGFDYQRYAAFNGWYYQVFLGPDDYIVDSRKVQHPFRQSLYTTRAWILNSFKKWIPGNIEAGMAEALLAGYKDDLDKDLVEQYANTGVVHIIAISGMHLALIYGILILFLQPLQKKKYGRLLSALMIIAALWFFSLLTGAAPSITRSAIMFTVIVIGNGFSKKTGIYNSLSAAAFVLLLVNPFNLWDVGFQLSFAALLSIAVFGKPITNWLSVTQKWLQKIWQLIAITIAAQILTLPLVVYHFHQFPLYFLLANMVAVPLSSIILYALLLLLMLSWLSPIASTIGWLLHYLIYAMNAYVGWVSQLPGATIGNVYYDIPQALCLVLLIATATWWLMHKSSSALMATILCLCIFSAFKWVQYFRSLQQQKLIVYNVSQHLAVDVIKGRHYQFIGDTALRKKGFLQNFHLLPSRVLHQATNAESTRLNDSAFASIRLNKFQLLILDKEPDLYHSDSVKTDFLLLNKNVRSKPWRILQKVRCSTIILDGSFSPYMIRQWKNAADSLHLRLYSVQEQGAFQLDF